MEFVNIRTLIKTVNAVNGCTGGCAYCYARRINNRFKIIPDFDVPQFFEGRLKQIKSTSRPSFYFMTSMSDFSDWQVEWRTKVFDHIKQCSQHSFLFLTKFPERISFNSELESAWMGATVTSEKEKKKIDILRQNVKAKHYFLTLEPLFNDLGELDLRNIGWIVIGTESGNRKGKITVQKDWIINIANQAKEENIPVFMKDSLSSIVGVENMSQQLPEQEFVKA